MASPLDFIAGTLAIMIPLALVLFGIFTAQVYFYLLEYQDDPAWLRLYVTIIWMAELAHSACCLHLIWSYLVVDFSDPLEVLYIIWSAGATIYLEVAVIALIQVYYIWRAWTLSQRKLTVAMIPGLTLFLRIAFSFATATLTYVYPTWPQFREGRWVKYTVNIGLSLGVVVDLMIAAFLIYELIQTQNTVRSHVHYIQAILNLVIGTGALTVLFSLVILLTFNLLPNSLTYAGLVEIISNLYANTMLANLNARKHLRNNIIAVPQVFESIELSTGSSSTRTTSGPMRRNVQFAKPVQVMKETTTMVVRDGDQDGEILDIKDSIV